MAAKAGAKSEPAPPAAAARPEPARIVTNRPISPEALKLAEREGADLAAIEGSGRGGRITYQDVQQALRPAARPALRGTAPLAEEPPHGSVPFASPLARRLAALHGIELWNMANDAGEQLESIPAALRFLAMPARMLDHPPERNMRGWDELCRTRRMVAIGGLDAHQYGKRVGPFVPVRVMSYRRSFRLIRTHVLCEAPPAREIAPAGAKVEIECVTIDQVQAAVDASADIILLDNMPVDLLRECVKLVRGRALLEASGGVNLENVRTIAETGVDMISVGALTHSAPAMNLALDFE